MAIVRMKPGTGNPGDLDEPSLEQRMTNLEAKVERIEVILIRLEPKVTESLLTGAKAVDLAEMKGRVSMLPTWWMLMVTVLSTWMVGAGIVFSLVKAIHP